MLVIRSSLDEYEGENRLRKRRSFMTSLSFSHMTILPGMRASEKSCKISGKKNHTIMIVDHGEKSRILIKTSQTKAQLKMAQSSPSQLFSWLIVDYKSVLFSVMELNWIFNWIFLPLLGFHAPFDSRTTDSCVAPKNRTCMARLSWVSLFDRKQKQLRCMEARLA